MADGQQVLTVQALFAALVAATNSDDPVEVDRNCKALVDSVQKDGALPRPGRGTGVDAASERGDGGLEGPGGTQRTRARRSFAQARPAGSVPDEDARHLARAFGDRDEERPDSDITEIPGGGGMVMSHVAKRPAGHTCARAPARR